MGAPEGPQSCVPILFFFVLCAARRDRVGLPNLLAGVASQRHHASPKTAAFIIRRCARALFARGDGHVDAIVVKNGRSGDMSGRESLHLGLPNQLAGIGIHARRRTRRRRRKMPHSASGISFDLADADRPSAHRRSALKYQRMHPELGIQRIDRAAGAANKDPPVRDGGVRVGVQRGGKSEGPFHF